MIFETSCSIVKKNYFFFKLSLFQNNNFWIFFIFGSKHPKTTKVVQKTAKIINLPYYLTHFTKNDPFFDVDLFSRTFDMELPSFKADLFV